jgi:hypothetical protein
MNVSKGIMGNRPLLEIILLLMGYGGIALTVLVVAILTGSSFFLPDEGLGVFYGVVLGVVGFTAGIGLIALSQIIGYLRIIAAGNGFERTFE